MWLLELFSDFIFKLIFMLNFLLVNCADIFIVVEIDLLDFFVHLSCLFGLLDRCYHAIDLDGISTHHDQDDYDIVGLEDLVLFLIRVNGQKKESESKDDKDG
jgi:hypothetical protein